MTRFATTRTRRPYMPKAIVADSHFDWGNDRQPRTPWHETVVYETHVKGLTATHEGIPPEQRGTYAGLAHPVMIDYLTKLGVTAVELMPIHQFIHDDRLEQLGLTNYWGYNSIAFLAPHNGYASRPGHEVVNEFKHMVRTLHDANIEVILDVVYNHTAEGNHLGPMLSFRGIDNPGYYRLEPDNPRLYYDTTGTGNTLNMRTPHVLQLIMDSFATGPWRCTSTDSASIWPPPWPGSSTRSTACPPSSIIIQQDPGHQSDEADRRAMGPRRWWLSGRQLPSFVVGMERPFP